MILLLQSRFVFFFSSRRRHTRLQGDWSSDVCSSDLLGPPLEHLRLGLRQVGLHREGRLREMERGLVVHDREGHPNTAARHLGLRVTRPSLLSIETLN